jgi:hypothetical protein
MKNDEDNGSSESPPARQGAARYAAAVAARQLAQKEMRRQAYQKAKERRAKDPRYLQMKEAAKACRREHYERVKQHRKAAQAAGKAQRSVERASAEADARTFFQKGRAPRTQLARGSGTSLVQASSAPRMAEVVSLLPADVVVANDVS